MKFKDAWRAAGNLKPGNTTWSADVDGRPVFTVWRAQDLGFDRSSRRSTLDIKPGAWVDRGEGKTYVRRVRLAIERGWVCRLIVLDGDKSGEHVDTATIEPNLFAARFSRVTDEGLVHGRLLTLQEYAMWRQQDGA